MTIDSGGPAFPSVGEGFNDPRYSAPGMTLRDYFAGQALVGILASGTSSTMSVDEILHSSYLFADGLIAQRGDPQ